MESAELLKNNAVLESLTRLGFKIRTFGPLPEGFDPLTATNRQLADHGLPRRPDAQTEAELRTRWERAITQTKTWIAPEFTEAKYGERSVRNSKPNAVPLIDNETSPIWAGATNFSQPDYAYTWVAAKWTVSDPNITTIPNSERNKEWVELTCVGIDGYLISPDVLQAGTGTIVHPPVTCQESAPSRGGAGMFPVVPAFR
jgi:hypothetical protein